MVNLYAILLALRIPGLFMHELHIDMYLIQVVYYVSAASPLVEPPPPPSSSQAL